MAAWCCIPRSRNAYCRARVHGRYIRALSADSLNVCRRYLGQANRRWTMHCLPLLRVTRAMPQKAARLSASAHRSFCDPNAQCNRGASVGPAPHKLVNRYASGCRSIISAIVASNCRIAFWDCWICLTSNLTGISPVNRFDLTAHFQVVISFLMVTALTAAPRRPCSLARLST